MPTRKILFILVVTLAIVAFFRFGPWLQPGDREEVGLTHQELANIEGRVFADLPPAEKAIRFYQDRIKQNPRSAANYTTLGQMHLRQARETGDVAGYQRAEAALRRALELLPGYPPAEASLASVLYAQHNFAEAVMNTLRWRSE